MSEGPRIPLPVARAAAAKLMELWRMAEPACLVVGSVRRQKEYVGDLEFIAPLPSGVDTLFDCINATCVDGEGMFAKAPTKERFAIPVKGFKRDFKLCSLVCHMVRSDETRWEIPVQIYRYGPGNRGWIELMRTGPAEFGQLFLHEWKHKHGITKGQASLEGYLVDAQGKKVDTWTESDCFRHCGMPFVDPIDRGRAAHARNFT